MKSPLLLDKDVVQTLIFRSWTTVSGVLMLLTIPFWLTPTEQGYFYLFYSIIALQVFFELGLNQIVMQRLSACFGKLSVSNDGLLSGLPEDLGDFKNILIATKKWYRNIVICFYIISLFVGCYMLLHSADEGASEALTTLAVLLVFVALNIFFSIELTARQSTSQVAEVAKLRTLQSISGYAILLVLVFLFDVGLAAILALSCTSCIFTYVWLKKHQYRYSVEPNSKGQVSWLIEFFPLQWKISVSWISGYLVGQFLILFIFREYGAELAGKYGITMSIFSAILAMGLSICVAKIPEIARLLSIGSNKIAFDLFRALLIRALLLVVLSMTVFILVVTCFYSDLNFLTERMLEPKLMFLFALVTTANTLIMSIAAYLRAHNKEPVLGLSVALALLVLLNIVFSIGQSIEILILGYMFIHVVVGIPWILLLLIRQLNSNGLSFFD